MTASNFPASLKLVLASEGGNDDDPLDHGGRTSRGITQREYDAWRSAKGLPIIDVWTAPQADVTTIYHDEYWNPYCDAMPTGIMEKMTSIAKVTMPIAISTSTSENARRRWRGERIGRADMKTKGLKIYHT